MEHVVGFWLSRQDLLMAWPSAVSEGDRHGVVFDLSHRENRVALYRHGGRGRK